MKFYGLVNSYLSTSSHSGVVIRNLATLALLPMLNHVSLFPFFFFFNRRGVGMIDD